MSLEDTRREYQYDSLIRKSLKKCPIDQFSCWMDESLQANLSDPTAMSLATGGGLEPARKCGWQKLPSWGRKT